MTTFDVLSVTTFVPLLILLGIGGRLLPVWMFINSMQLLVHTPLLSMHMPANLHYFLTHYLNYFSLNFEFKNTEIAWYS